MNDVTVLGFDGSNVRTLTIDGNPWFVAKDICLYFGDTDYKRSISKIASDDRCLVPVIDSMGRSQEATAVNESGMYSLLFGFSPERARNDEDGNVPPHIQERIIKINKFKKWITSEVLPSIRKNGGYLAPTVDFSNPDNIRKLLDAWTEDRKKLDKANEKILIDAPKVIAHDVLIKTDTTMSITDAGKHFGLHPKIDVFPYLRHHGYLTTKDMPTQYALDNDILVLVETVIDSGITKKQAKVEARQLVTWAEKIVPRIVKG